MFQTHCKIGKYVYELCFSKEELLNEIKYTGSLYFVRQIDFVVRLSSGAALDFEPASESAEIKNAVFDTILEYMMWHDGIYHVGIEWWEAFNNL